MIPLGKPIEQILGGGALLLLAVGCALVLRPFVSAILWAAVICFSTWPVYERCERAVGGNKILAAALMTLLVGLVLVAPFAVMAATLTDSVGNLLRAVNQILEHGPPHRHLNRLSTSDERSLRALSSPASACQPSHLFRYYFRHSS
jgi:predicted PurR-regulated permease PerM